MKLLRCGAQATLCLTLATVALGHSFLVFPDAYNRQFQLRNCVGSECLQACPSNITDMRNTPEKPAVTWQRGQDVQIRWARNNHLNGFVRLAIVPLNVMMSRRWHDHLAIWYGCFGQGKYRCYGDRCGSDNTRHAYRAFLKVPTILPNGIYVLGMVWYGGTHWPLTKNTFFSDYWSCSYIRIEGGRAMGGYHEPYFQPGNDMFARSYDGRCLTAVDAPGVCSKMGCKGPAYPSVPRPFKWGRKPKRLWYADIKWASLERKPI